VFGQFELASAGRVLAGYDQGDPTQAVREMVYQVLSEFVKNWQEASVVQ
jgi:hypothetical protein